MDRLQKTAPTAARLVLGLLFTTFGLNGFLQFMPMPPMPEAANAFLGALGATGYMSPLLHGTEVVAGLMLIAGRAVPLALVLLAPVLMNIAAFHLFLAPGGMPIAIFALAMGLYVAYQHRAVYRPLFGGAEPAVERTSRPSELSVA